MEPTMQPEEAKTETPAVATPSAVAIPGITSRGADTRGAIRGRAPGRGGAAGGRGGPRRDSRAPRERSEFDQVTIDARRVARVMAGGRRFNFSIAIVLGDRK